MGAPDFWNDQERAQKVVAELKTLKVTLDPLRAVSGDLEDLRVLYDLGREENDRATLEEVDAKLTELERKMDELETRSLLSRKHDHRNCFLSIYAGDGGTEAN